MEKKLHVISCHVLWRELCHYAAISDNVFTFHFLKQGLHDTPDILRNQLQQSIENAPDECDAILLGYGLCSNGIVGIKAEDKKLVLMRGHDCITFLLGSRQRYQQYFEKYPGTYWYSPGWIETGSHPMPGKKRLDLLRKVYVEKYGEENADYLMQMEHNWIREYSRATYVDFNYFETTHYKKFSQKCARELGWDYDELTGDPSLIRDFVNGTWKSDNFLIVEPGESIRASYDERVICTR
ncbi:DUF1638 domain-containing protein [candidate division KSB1 bacterium]|nr:DUF1638 domain-containing protein [candidate division KSB1 bacterium]